MTWKDFKRLATLKMVLGYGRENIPMGKVPGIVSEALPHFRPQQLPGRKRRDDMSVEILPEQVRTRLLIRLAPHCNYLHKQQHMELVWTQIQLS